jgi:putative transport protein
MIDLLVNNPLLLLFVVAAVGYPLGKLSVGGVSLGVAAVLFAGIGIGALDPRLKLPEIVYQLGLLLFVYTVGLSSGRTFFASFNRRGLRDNAFVLSMLLVGAGLSVGLHALLKLSPTITAGMFTGSLNNTAALAAALGYIKDSVPTDQIEAIINDPVVGYSITYPMGVLGMILSIVIMQRVWKVNYRAGRDGAAAAQTLTNRTIRITRPAATIRTVHELIDDLHPGVIFGRFRHDGELGLIQSQTRFAAGDLVSVVGDAEHIETVRQHLGEFSDEELAVDRSAVDYRRILVSNPKIAGHRLRDLNLPQHLGAVVTRLRRGDIEFLPQGDTLLELGDRVRVVAHRDNMPAVSAFFGDSYRHVSEIDVLTFTLGMVLGLLVGMIAVPLGGGVSIKLGFAGGPLVVALILGALHRTGPLVWHIPYSANLTLRQIGLVFFLAGVGTRAGYEFITTLKAGGGLVIFAAGAGITLTVGLLSLFIGHKLLKIPMARMIGVLAGIQTQPALLGFAVNQTGDEEPNVGYAAVYPMALIAKIVLAQVLLALML